MKLKNLLFIMVAAVGMSNARAENAEVPQIITLTLTIYSQKSANDDGTNTTFVTETKKRTTVDLLKALAQDKFAQAQWPSNSFPATAKLAVMNGAFLVVNGTNLLVDVSDIVGGSGGGNDSVKSGKRNDLTDLGAPNIKRIHLITLTVDDSAIVGGAGVQFSLTGLMKDSETDTTPTAAGVYTQTTTAMMVNGVGEGMSDGNPFYCTGTLTAKGKGTLVLSPTM